MKFNSLKNVTTKYSLRNCVCVYIYIYKVKLATIIKGNPKAPVSIATKPRCRGEHYSCPWIASFYP